NETAWRVQQTLMGHVANVWSTPDAGIWEVRGERRHFTYSKIMAWVAVDRAIKSVEAFGVDGPVEQWQGLRARIHADVCAHGFNSKQNAFVQRYDSAELDASLLQIPLTGFLPPEDPRVAGTVEAIKRHLTIDGFVRRYRTLPDLDGLPAGEGVFLACS